MTEIRSRRKVTLTLLVSIMVWLAILCCGLLLILSCCVGGGEIWALVLGILICCPPADALYMYIRNSRRVRVDKEGIVLGDKAYSWKDIERITLSAKQTFTVTLVMKKLGVATLFPPYIYGRRFERNLDVIKLCLLDAPPVYLFDGVYSNAWQVRAFIQQVVIDKGDYAEYEEHDVKSEDIRMEQFVLFKGSQLKSFRGIMMWLAFVLQAVFAIVGIWHDTIMFLCMITTPFVILSFVSYSLKMSFFGVSERYLLVRKYNLPGWKGIFLNDDIKEVVFEFTAVSTEAVTIILKNYKSYSYAAPIMSMQEWFKLKDELERNGVKVQNNIYNENFKD